MKKIKEKIIDLFDLFKKHSDLIGYVVLSIFFVYINIKMYVNMDKLIDSDMSSELILAKMLANEKNLITTSWFYSSEIRILNTNLVFAPLFLITDNWHIVRIVGLIILNLILFASFYYLAKQLEIKHIPWIAFLILGSISKDYFLFVTLGSFYVPHFAISFISLGLIISIFKNENKKNLKLVVLLVLAFAAGLEGMRLVSITYLPLVITSALYCLFKQLENLKVGKFYYNDKSVVLFVVCVLGFVASYAGAFVNSNILPNFGYSYKMDGTELYYSDFDLNSLSQVIDGWIDVLGYQSDNMYVFIPSQLIIKPLFAMFFIVVVWSTIDILKNRYKYRWEEIFITMFFIVAAIIISALFVLTTTQYVNRYLLPVSVFVVFVVGIFFTHYKIDWQKWLLMILVVFFVIFNTRFQIHFQRDNNIYVNESLMNVYEIIRNQDCKNGYTIDHWNGHNLFTELSNGKIETYRFNNGNIDSIGPWLQAKSHVSKKPEGKVFLLLLQSEVNEISFNEDVSKYKLYEDNERILYIFDSYQQLKALTS